MGAHLASFAAKVTGETARSLIETYRVSLEDAALSHSDIVSRLKTTMEARLEEPTHAPPRAVNH